MFLWVFGMLDIGVAGRTVKVTQKLRSGLRTFWVMFYPAYTFLKSKQKLESRKILWAFQVSANTIEILASISNQYSVQLLLTITLRHFPTPTENMGSALPLNLIPLNYPNCVKARNPKISEYYPQDIGLTSSFFPQFCHVGNIRLSSSRVESEIHGG